MTTAVLALLSTFALVMLAELPDKTTVTTLVLTTRFRAKPVFVGAAAAFALQTVVAVGFGSVLTLLPDALVSGIVAALFAIGAVILLRAGFAPPADAGEDAARAGPSPVSFRRAAVSSFGVLFAAEWADASQLATASLAARFGQPLAVGVGAFASLLAVTVLAVFVGNKFRDRIRPKLLQRTAGIIFAGFAAFEASSALT